MFKPNIGVLCVLAILSLYVVGLVVYIVFLRNRGF